ncbi:unnamed protein product [Larinioides sclopetarius]|uniref:Uncharacterized protein n=1 Tax=Larinioides sclopetarius TaxID=280406 RepID=A0AAV1ZZE6_9ARAC
MLLESETMFVLRDTQLHFNLFKDDRRICVVPGQEFGNLPGGEFRVADVSKISG